jgi:biotin-(acetyl-CoA carboxylase) ligase
MMASLREAERALDLPPGFTLVSLRESGDAFAHGLAIAEDAGAGTLVWVGRYDLVELAIVLEPDEPLASARRALFVGMNATADAIAAHCQPEREVSFAWPDTILFDGGLLGGARLGWPADCAEGDVPAWLVLGIMLRAADMAHVETGTTPWGMSLTGAGIELVKTEAIVGSLARHLMTGFDQWNERGFTPIADAYLALLPKSKAGERRSIDGNGDLLVNAPADRGPPDRVSLLEGLARTAWYDSGLGGPKLE